MKPTSCIQRLVYFNTFSCRPVSDTSSGTTTQQNWMFQLCLNSPWLFDHDWNAYSNSNQQAIAPNTPIVPSNLSGQPDATTTAMPGLKDGFNLFHQYAHGVVIGSKVTISAQPTENDGDASTQAGVLYAIKSAKKAFGLNLTSNLNDVQKLPFRQMRRIAGPASGLDQYASGFNNRDVGAKMVITHSPKKFNNVQSLRDNDQFQFGQSLASTPNGTAPSRS